MATNTPAMTCSKCGVKKQNSALFYVFHKRRGVLEDTKPPSRVCQACLDNMRRDADVEILRTPETVAVWEAYFAALGA